MRKCQVYPKEFCQAVCAGIAAQKKMDKMGMMSLDIMSIEEMMLVVPEAARDCNPSQEFHEQWGMERMTDAMNQTDWINSLAFDDQSGARMKPEMVVPRGVNQRVLGRDQKSHNTTALG